MTALASKVFPLGSGVGDLAGRKPGFPSSLTWANTGVYNFSNGSASTAANVIADDRVQSASAGAISALYTLGAGAQLASDMIVSAYASIPSNWYVLTTPYGGDFAIAARVGASPNWNRYVLRYNSGADTSSGFFELGAVVAGAVTTIGSYTFPLYGAAQVVKMRLDVIGTRITCWVNDVPVIGVTDTTVTGVGTIGLAACGNASGAYMYAMAARDLDRLHGGGYGG